MRGFSLALAFVLPLALAPQAGAQNPQIDQRLTVLEQQVDGLLRGSGGGAGAAASPDGAVRLDQLENQVRALTGQVEALRFELNQLRSGGGAPATQGQLQPPASQGQQPGQLQGQQRGDVFQPSNNPNSLSQDPGSLNNQAQSLGGTPGFGQGQAQPPAVGFDQGGQAGGDSLAPLDLSTLGGVSGFSGSSSLPGQQAQNFTPASSPEEAFEFSKIYIQTGEYDLAEAGFRQFIQTYPDNPLVPEARFWIGESQLQRQQYRQAAESFLTIYENNGNSPLVPESLYKLGLSLKELNASEDACGAFSEALNHPRASGETRARAQQESQNMRCG